MQLFIFLHQNYCSNELCEEIESIQREEDESVVDLDLGLTQHSYRFCDHYWLLEKDYDLFRISLIYKYFFESKRELFFGYVDSTQLGDFNDIDCEVESHESLGYPPFLME